jgi:hypothetical protein
VRGWINYYGAFYRSMLYSLAARIDELLVRWAMQKFERLRGRPSRAWRWLDTVRRHLWGSRTWGTLLTSDDRNRERFGMIAAIMPCHRQPPITAGHPRAPSSGTHHTIGGTTPPIR